MSRIACAWIWRQAELRHQAVARLGRTLRRADQRDHRIDVIERDLQAFEDVAPGLGLAQLELGAPPHDLAPELDEVVDELDERAGPSAGRRRWPA